MRLPKSRDVQPGLSRSIRHVATRLSTAGDWSGERPTKRALATRDDGGAMPQALADAHRAARAHDRRLYSSVGALRTSYSRRLQTPDRLDAPTRCRWRTPVAPGHRA